MYNYQENPKITKVIEEAKTIIGDLKDIPNNEEGRQMIEKIAKGKMEPNIAPKAE